MNHLRTYEMATALVLAVSSAACGSKGPADAGVVARSARPTARASAVRTLADGRIVECVDLETDDMRSNRLMRLLETMGQATAVAQSCAERLPGRTEFAGCHGDLFRVFEGERIRIGVATRYLDYADLKSSTHYRAYCDEIRGTWTELPPNDPTVRRADAEYRQQQAEAAAVSQP